MNNTESRKALRELCERLPWDPRETAVLDQAEAHIHDKLVEYGIDPHSQFVKDVEFALAQILLEDLAQRVAEGTDEVDARQTIGDILANLALVSAMEPCARSVPADLRMTRQC